MKKTETKSVVLLRHHLKALKLPTMHEECEKIARRCAADNADHLAFLLQLCELELIDRERRSADRRLKAAKFPTSKTLETFDFKAQPSVNKSLVLELMRCDYLDQRENVLLVGNTGTGKTHLATALGVEACGRGKVYAHSVTLTGVEERFAADLPYVLAMIDLDEGIRMMGNVVECNPEEVSIGMDVEVVFHQVTDEITLPQWRPVRG